MALFVWIVCGTRDVRILSYFPFFVSLVGCGIDAGAYVHANERPTQSPPPMKHVLKVTVALAEAPIWRHRKTDGQSISATLAR